MLLIKGGEKVRLAATERAELQFTHAHLLPPASGNVANKNPDVVAKATIRTQRFVSVRLIPGSPVSAQVQPNHR
jgi:hypothetical protein